MKRASVGSHFISLFAGVAGAAFAAGCGGDTNTNVTEDSLVIEAYVEGTVIDGVTHTPIAGASVIVPGVEGAQGTATTDARGFYSIEVPGVGSHTLFVEAADYARAKYTVSAITEPGASGEIRVTAVRNSQLYPVSETHGGTLNGRVTSGGSRDSIAGARVLVQFGDSTDPIEDGSIAVTAVTDDDGRFSLAKLPAGAPQTRVTVFPFDLDDDGTPDTATFSNLVTGGPSAGALTPGGQNFMDIVVDPFLGDKVIWTNLDDGATVDSDSALLIQYATPMVRTADATTVTLRENNSEIGADFVWQGAVSLTVTPKEPLLPGRNYTLNVVAQSLAGTSVTYNKAFSVTSPDAPTDPVTNVEIVDAEPLDWKARAFVVAFDAVAGAEGYRIFARNGTDQTSWVMVFENRVSQFGRPQVSVTLPDSFDTFPSDDVFSATGFGTKVEFAVQPYSGKNDGPMPEQLASIQDTNCPNLLVTPPTNTNNSEGTAAMTVKYLLASVDGEPLADEPAPRFTFATSGSSTDAAIINNRTMAIRRLRAGQFEVTFTVPAGVSGVGDTVSIDLRGVTDTTLNAPDGTLRCPNTQTILSSL